MTTFTDGPAQGQTLTLQRAPYFLRVVHSPGTASASPDRGAHAPPRVGDGAPAVSPGLRGAHAPARVGAGAPAGGPGLRGAHAPARVCAGAPAGGHWDALDQLTDQPEPDEKIYAYECVCLPMRGFIDGSKYRGPYVIAQYKLVSPQPSDTDMRTTAAWHAWTLAHAPGHCTDLKP